MTEKEAREILYELQEVGPEQLEGEAKKLFEAIMKITDERDELKNEVREKDNRMKQLENMNKFQSKDIKEAVDYTFELNEEIELKDKTIDLMANHIATNDSNLCQYLDMTTKCKYYAGENGKTCDECIKQYFGNKVREVG